MSARARVDRFLTGLFNLYNSKSLLQQQEARFYLAMSLLFQISHVKYTGPVNY
jgi:hypothetical protein